MCWLRQHHAVSSWVAPPADGVPRPPCSCTVEQEGRPALPHPLQPPCAGGSRAGALGSVSVGEALGSLGKKGARRWTVPCLGHRKIQIAAWGALAASSFVLGLVGLGGSLHPTSVPNASLGSSESDIRIDQAPKGPSLANRREVQF